MPTKPLFTNTSVRLPISDGLRANVARERVRILRDQILVDGVFEGGGALGTAYLGGLRALQENGMWFKRVAGNSAGSITAAMIAVGFTASEIQWLSSAFLPRPSALASLSAVGITAPIPFADFLDLPDINSISQSSKRKTLLWQALKGTIIDEIGKKVIPIPTQSAAVNACMHAILDVPALGDAIRLIPGTQAQILMRDALNTALVLLPNKQLHISDFVPDTEDIRIPLADTLWDAIVRNNPIQLLMTNLVHEGGIFEGKVFLNTLKTLFGKKVHQNPSATVLFKDLAIPLAVIAANIDTGEMVVYSSKNHPNMEVAEAVRQSMSIPFVFEPRGNRKQIVDGGLYSNFPVWLYSAPGDTHWDPADIDNSRLKIGFSLDAGKRTPRTWNVQPARFNVSGTPPHVDSLEVVKPILIARLVECGMPRDLAEADITWALLGETLSNGSSRPGVELLQQLLGVTSRGVMNTEASMRKITTEGLMHGLPYVDIPIPLLGFDAFDFYINEEEGPLMAMWDRAWQKTIEELLAAAERGILPARARITSIETPFN